MHAAAAVVALCVMPLAMLLHTTTERSPELIEAGR
jgi:hypothetical protein